MSPREQIDAFTAHVKSLTGTFTESRSSLKNLFIYLRSPLNQTKRFINIQDAISKCSNPRDNRITKYTPALRSLVEVWGTAGTYQRTATTGIIPTVIVTPTTSVTGASISPINFVNAVKDKLAACKDYVCNDVGTFAQCINSKLPKSEQDRIRQKTPVAVGMPIISDGSWRAGPLKVAHDRVVEKQAGECTNYAYYAAHILWSSTSGPKPKIEIVSWEGQGTAKHLFVIVGRTGGVDASRRLPAPSSWNDDCVIVDCWALTLGHGYIFSKSNYCFRPMMTPAKLEMDSTVTETAGPINVQGGLRKTGISLK